MARRSLVNTHTVVPVSGFDLLVERCVVTVDQYGKFHAWTKGTKEFKEDTASHFGEAETLEKLEAKVRRGMSRDKIRIDVPFSTRDGEGRYTGRNKRTGNWDFVIVKKGGQSSSGQDWRPQTGSYHDTKLRPLTPTQRTELDRLIKEYQEASARHDKFIEKHRYDEIEVVVKAAWKKAGGDEESAE